jgi:hypothetical protein
MTMVTNTPLARLVTLKAMLKLEIIGMKRSRSPSAFSILKTMGYRGNRAAVLEQVSKDAEEGIIKMHTQN